MGRPAQRSNDNAEQSARIAQPVDAGGLPGVLIDRP